MALSNKEAQWERAAVYVRYVATVLRNKGWGVEILERGSMDQPDPGDLRVELPGGTVKIIDVKESQTWSWDNRKSRDWFNHDWIALTSTDQFHKDWWYMIVATDFHMMAFVQPELVTNWDKIPVTRYDGVGYNMLCADKNQVTPLETSMQVRPLQ